MIKARDTKGNRTNLRAVDFLRVPGDTETTASQRVLLAHRLELVRKVNGANRGTWISEGCEATAALIRNLTVSEVLTASVHSSGDYFPGEFRAGRFVRAMEVRRVGSRLAGLGIEIKLDEHLSGFSRLAGPSAKLP